MASGPSRDGLREYHFSTTSTQSGASTHAAHGAENARKVPGSRLPQEVETYDREDPRPCSTYRPMATGD